MNQEERNKICQELFGKDEQDVKYLMLTCYVHHQLIEGEDCLRTGLYSWLPVWNGEVRAFQEMDPSEYKNYDIIHVNMSGQDIHILGNIKENLPKDSKTILVANNDYTVELWQGSFDYMDTMRREVNHADVLFGTEPYQVGALECLMGRKVHLIVHPCFTKRLKSLQKPKQKDVISMSWHRYDNYAIPPSLAIKDLGYKTRIIGYDPSVDKKMFNTSVHYNDILTGTNYMDFCNQLMESKVVVDPFTLTSQGRVGWDCAALGVALVGSNRNYSHRVCYPFSSCDPFDIKEIRRLTKLLLTDEQFRKKVIDYAYDAVEYVSYDSSKDKFLKALKEGSKPIQL